MEKKSISPLVSTALLLVVAFITVIGFQNWFGSYSSNIFSQVELESKDALTNDVEIKQLLSNVLYVTSDSSDNISVKELKINGDNCLLSSSQLESGMNEIPIINCLGNLTSPKIEVFLNTEQGIYSYYFYFENYMLSSEAIIIPSLIFESNDTGVDYGDDINLSWTSSNAINCSASGDWSGTKPVSGFEIQNNLIANMTYNLNCSSEDGSTLRTVNVNVGAPPAPALIFNSNDTAIAYDTSINLSWSATDSTNCIASGDWSGAKPLQGNEVITGINSTQTFNLTCSGVGGTIEQLVTVNVAAAEDCIGPDSSVILHGNSKTFYLASSVPYNQVCAPETITCYNGNLNGTYSNPTCVINNCPFGTIMGLCSICDGAGIASTQAPADDASCGIIDCDGLDNYYITGTQGATTTSYCNFDNYADLSSARCKAEFDCKDPNSADCGSPVTTTPNTAGVCQYIAGCIGSTPGSVSNYNTATACSGTLDCDVNNYYHITGTQGATTTSYCKYEDYADTTRKCNGAGACSALNCGAPVQSNQATAGVCKYISGCTGGLAGSVVNYASGTSCGAGMECNGAGSCISSCSTYTVTEGGFVGVYGYYPPFAGSISPTTYKGVSIEGIKYMADVFFYVTMPGNIPQNFFTSIQPYAGGPIYYTSTVHTYEVTGGVTNWWWLSSNNDYDGVGTSVVKIC